MMEKFSERIERQNRWMIALDLFMMLLIIVNLLYIIVEFNYEIEMVNNWLKASMPAFHKWYGRTLHKNFFTYDIGFVTIFLIEFLIRWIVSVRRKQYAAWFFYPFFHWYDVLGLIPVGSFRALRLLRIIAIIMRLHKMGVINLKKTILYQQFAKYREIVTEEISDRVVVNVLNGMQREIKTGSPLMQQIITEVIQPNQEFLVEYLSHRMQKVTSHAHDEYKDQLEAYVELKTAEAVSQNIEIKRLNAIPMVGPQLSKTLQSAVGDITHHVINSMILDMASPNNKPMVQELVDVGFDAVLIQEEDPELDAVVKDMVRQSIDLVKAQVMVKQWQLDEEALGRPE